MSRHLTEPSVARSLREFRDLAQRSGITLPIRPTHIRLCPSEFTGWTRRQVRTYLRQTMRLASAES